MVALRYFAFSLWAGGSVAGLRRVGPSLQGAAIAVGALVSAGSQFFDESDETDGEDTNYNKCKLDNSFWSRKKEEQKSRLDEELKANIKRFEEEKRKIQEKRSQENTVPFIIGVFLFLALPPFIQACLKYYYQA